MEFFNYFFATKKTSKVDFIAELPLEVSQLILRYLDPASLLSAARVSHSWLKVCKSDKFLKQKASDYKSELERHIFRERFISALSGACFEGYLHSHFY